MSRLERYKHGVLLYRMGDPVQGLYVVVTGALRTACRSRQDVASSWATCRRETRLLWFPRSTKGLRCRTCGRTATQLLCLFRGILYDSLLERQPTLLFRLATDLCHNIRRFGAHIERLTMLRLRQRVAHSLLSLAGSYGHTTGAGIEIELKVSQDDLAAMLSVSRQRVNLELRLLVSEGIVSTRYSHITILDQPRLAARAADDSLFACSSGAVRPLACGGMQNLSPTR